MGWRGGGEKGVEGREDEHKAMTNRTRANCDCAWRRPTPPPPHLSISPIFLNSCTCLSWTGPIPALL